jgi:hypothetical protein
MSGKTPNPEDNMNAVELLETELEDLDTKISMAKRDYQDMKDRIQAHEKHLNGLLGRRDDMEHALEVLRKAEEPAGKHWPSNWPTGARDLHPGIDCTPEP